MAIQSVSQLAGKTIASITKEDGPNYSYYAFRDAQGEVMFTVCEEELFDGEGMVLSDDLA